VRIVVIGGPRTGKTTYATKLAKQLGVHLGSTGKRTEQEDGLVSTDNYMRRSNWKTLPEVVIKDLKNRDSWVLEGTQAARVLRRWLKESPSEVKVDKVLVFNRPWVARNAGQEAMAKGVRTILKDLQPLLSKAGIEVEHMTPPEMTPEEWTEHKRERFEESESEALPLAQDSEVMQDTP
jgi:adenylate kinase family enzyme